MAPWWKVWDLKPQASEALSVMTPPAELPAAAPARSFAAALMPMGTGLSNHPGWGLTAERIRGAYLSAEQGYPAYQCDVFDDVIERDAHLRSQVDGCIEAVAGKAWIVQAGGEDAADTEAAKMLERALRVVPNMQETIEHLLTATHYGYAGTEIGWDRVDGLTVPVWFANVPHRRFLFALDTDEARLITQANMSTGEALAPGRWIFVRRRGRQTVRAGLMRTATWWSWMKSLSTRDWQIFSNRFGLPFVVAKYPEGANEEERAKLRKSIQAFGQQGGALLPEQSTLEILERGQGGSSEPVHPAFVAMCNSEMSKLFTGATLTSGEGSSAGSYALGQVHADRSFDRTQGEAERLGYWVSLAIGAPFVRFNGLTARPPRLKVRVVREVDPLQRMQIADIFCNKLGGKLDEDQIRDEFDFKRPTGASLSGAPVPAAAPPAPGAKPPAA